MGYTLQYYDLVLVAVAVSVLGGVVIGLATPVAMVGAIPGAGLISILIIGHALFINGPVDEMDDLTDEVDPEAIPVVDKATEVVN